MALINSEFDPCVLMGLFGNFPESNEEKLGGEGRTHVYLMAEGEKSKLSS